MLNDWGEKWFTFPLALCGLFWPPPTSLLGLFWWWLDPLFFYSKDASRVSKWPGCPVFQVFFSSVVSGKSFKATQRDGNSSKLVQIVDLPQTALWLLRSYWNHWKLLEPPKEVVLPFCEIWSDWIFESFFSLEKQSILTITIHLSRMY